MWSTYYFEKRKTNLDPTSRLWEPHGPSMSSLNKLRVANFLNEAGEPQVTHKQIEAIQRRIPSSRVNEKD